MLVGYLRVSSADERQSVDLQRDALLTAGVDERHFHVDKASGARDDRPGLKACLAYLKAGDVLVVWKLDRLGRSLPHLLAIVADLKDRDVAFRSLTEQMDTTTPHVTALEGGASKASVCRTFKVPRSTLIDTLARVGWTGPRSPPGEKATTAAKKATAAQAA